MTFYHWRYLLWNHLRSLLLYFTIFTLLIINAVVPSISNRKFSISLSPVLQEVKTLVIAVSAYLVLRGIKNCLIKNAGAAILVDVEKGALIKGSNGMLSLDINVSVDGWKPHNDPQKAEDIQIHWGQSDNIEVVKKLHQEAHGKTLWAYVIEDVAERNTAHIVKNNKSIYILYTDSKSENAIGYTHVVPVNIHTWNKFKSGAISTSEIKADYICHYPTQTNDDEPFGLIILSLVMSKIPLPRKYELPTSRRGEITRQFYAGRIITLALAHHLDAYRNREFKHTRVIPVMFQSANPAVKEFIEPYKKNPTEYSKEKVEIFCFDLENPHARPLPKCCALNEGGMVSLIQLPALASRYV